MDINWLDITLILTMLVSGFLALTQGFMKEILSLIGWVISFLAVIILMPEAGRFLRPFIESDSLSDLISIALIFLITLMIWRVFSILIVRLFKITSIGYIDRILGFIFGTFRIYILASIVFIVFILPMDKNERPDYIKSSITSPLIEVSTKFILKNIPSVGNLVLKSQVSSLEILESKENEFDESK